MSLINDVLKNAAKQHDNKVKQVDPAIKGMVDIKKSRLPWLIVLACFMIILLLILYFYLPGMAKQKKHMQAITASAPATEQIKKNKIMPKISQTALAKIAAINMLLKKNQAILNIQPNKEIYYYLHTDAASNQLVITLENVTLQAKVPENATNTIVKAMDIRQADSNVIITMQLLPETQVQSLQFNDKETPNLQLVLFNPNVHAVKPAVLHKTEVPLSREQKIQQKYQMALKYLEQSRSKDAISLLYSIIQDAPDYYMARETLAVVLMKKSAFAAAARILVPVLKEDPENSNFALLQAHILVKQDKIYRAIHVLQNATPPLYEQPDYYAFLAALYQRHGDYMTAARVYDQLVKSQPFNAIWWVGLGVAFESAHKNNAAAEAYKKALKSAGLSSQLRTFVEARLTK